MGIMTHLVEALRIMDEKGRRAADHHSYMLWEKEWIALRHEIIEAVFVASPQPTDSMAEEKPCIECGQIGRHLFGCKMPKLDSADGATECHCESPAWPLDPCVNCGGMPPLI